MGGGFDLAQPGDPPRKRGRPKGSVNRRSKDLAGFVGAKYGGSAAQQSAALCMVTPGELKRAGGSMAKAQVAKAVELLEHVRQAQEGFDERLRQVVREELRDLAHQLVGGERTREVVNGFLHRIREGSARFGLKEAMDLIGRERAALLPYTDQRQPLAIEAAGDAWRPAVVVMGASVENAGLSPVIEGQVSRSRSHDEGQPLDPPQLFGPDASPAE